MKRNKINNPQWLSTKCLASLLVLSSAIQGVQAQEPIKAAKLTPAKTNQVMVETKTITGVVTDAATGQPILGARITVLGNPRFSAMTNEKGEYTLQAPTLTSMLYVEIEEYNGLQVAVKEGESIDAQLYPIWFSSAYNKTGAIFNNPTASVSQSTSLAADNEIGNKLNANVRTITRGGQPAQGAAMFINGLNSLNSVVQPLIVVDGVIWDMQYDRSSIHQGFVNNVLNVIDPEDIEDVEVITNGAALYGARGGNGVIKITTKRSKSMVTRIRVTTFGGFETKPSVQKMMTGDQFRKYATELLGTTAYAQTTAGSTLQPFQNDNPNFVFYPLYHNNTDWSDGLYRKAAFLQNYKAVVEGGDDVARYNLSLGYANAQSTAKNNDFDRLNIRFNTNVNLFPKVEADIDIAYSRVSYNVLDNGWASDYTQRNIASPNVLGLIQTPFISKYEQYIVWDEQTSQNKLVSSTTYTGKTYGSESNPFRYTERFGYSALVNPYWILLNGEGENKNAQAQTQFSLNVAPSYQVNDYLRLTNRFSYIVNRTSEKYYLPFSGTPDKKVPGLGTINSTLASQFAKSTNVFNEFNVGYKRIFGAHNLNANAGVRFTTLTYADDNIRGFNNSNDKMPNIVSSLQYITVGGANDTWTNLAYYIDANYNYLGRYYARLITTAESSSRFGKKTEGGIQAFGVSWGIFPSLQLGWVVSAEPWFKAKAINYLNLRAGVDVSGNDNIDYYASRTYFSNGKFLDRATMLDLANISNNAIQWENTTRWSVAADARFFNNRLSVGTEFFYAKTSNLLAQRDPGYATGFAKVWTNGGELTNKGVNAHFTAALINTRKWRWELGASIGAYKNELTALPAAVSSSDLTNTMNLYALDANGVKVGTPTTIHGYTSSVYGSNNILTSVGSAVGVFYGYQTQGVFTTEAEAANAGKYGHLRYPTGLTTQPYRNFHAGDVHFVDQNGDGWISEADMVKIGDPNPTAYGNIFTSLGYKRLKLDVNFKYSFGGDIYNYQRAMIESGSNLFNQSTALTYRWQRSGDVTLVPRVMSTSSDAWVNNERFSDRWIEDGSFLRLKRVRLTYKVPVREGFVQGLSVWGEANNVFTLSKYSGRDPEVTVGNGALSQGIDAGYLPQGTSFNLGVSLNL